MAGYEYNPLLKLNLQKKDDSATPGDIDRLEGEIEALRSNVSDKVPKFFNSIEELEVGEIGEYQGETNEDFTHGYFYERTEPISIIYSETQKAFPYTQYMDVIINRELYKRYYGLSEINYNVNQITEWYSNQGEYTVAILLINSSLIVGNNLLNFVFLNNEYVVYPYPIILPRTEDNKFIDFDNPINVISNKFIYKGTELSLTGYQLGATIYPGIEIEAPHRVVGWLRYSGSYFGFVMDSNLLQIAASKTLTEFEIADGIRDTPTVSSQISIQEYSFVANGLFSRVDTQPALDPSDFATATQGEKADTALQGISKGTDGDYITTTVTAKDANNQQTVAVSVKVQSMATADNDHKGLAEASNVKAYAATAAQGAKADSALQSISKGTDGDYINTTVSAKTNNNQTVAASLTIQDINTADTDHRGLLEALSTRNYIDNEIYKISLNFFFYGIQWDENDPSPDCVRIGNMSLHAELPIQNAIIGGLLQDDLTFTPFADQSDWSGETVDGSVGQLMLQIPKHYFKSEIHGTIHKKLISQYPLAGFIEIPLMYVSAEKATVDRTDPTTPKLCSVVNSSPEYRGGQNTAGWDNTYRSLLGKPASNISLTNFRQYARNRGNGTAWNCHIYLAQRVLYWLFVTEYATLNSQKNFNAAKDANGYAQGGLGPGVSDWNSDTWLSYNNHNPLIPCGYMLEYGNQSAVKNYNILDADGNTLHTFSVNSYRGIRSPFGDIWDWTDGILINVQSDAAGGVSTCYITDDPAKFSSSDFSQYTELGNTPCADNWIKTIFDGEQGDIICKTRGGSSTSYYCDYYWGANLPASGVSLRGVIFGGSASNGSLCGFLYASSHYVPGYVHPSIGSRLCAIPPP